MPLKGKKILVLITEDWFAVSHFLPLIEALVATGANVVVATRLVRDGPRIAATGARIVAFDFARGPLRPLREAAVLARLVALLRRERPDAVHAIALKPIGLSLGAVEIVRVPVFAAHLTGVGLAGTSPEEVGGSGMGRAFAAIIALLRRALRLRGVPGAHRVHLFAENPDDAAALLGAGSHAKGDAPLTLLGGAGVDPAAFPAQPLPDGEPLRIGYVGRMVWTKGVDTLVAAHRDLARRGVGCQLDLCGAPDADNPAAIPVRQLEEWGALDGITWHGRVSDVSGFWRDRHLCAVPSRGGEGLPRALLEAAASGRAIVASDVPGCRHFVRDGQEGLMVAPGDARALADAIERLARDRAALARMGQAARARLVANFTEDHLREDVRATYERLFGSG